MTFWFCLEDFSPFKGRLSFKAYIRWSDMECLFFDWGGEIVYRF